MIRIFVVVIAIAFSSSLFAQRSRITREEYINTYKDLAISEMRRSGVPASIKLAQGIIETGNGNSRLALAANNHFGIKCHNSWTGRRIYHDDDEKGECFRRYKNATESFSDHSDFLRGSLRYAFLFELAPTDYKAWAVGLQTAGYATNPGYSTSLIRVIEESELFRYDLAGLSRQGPYRTVVDTEERPVYRRNRVKFVIAEEGDSFEEIRKEMNLLPTRLHRYNELSLEDSIYEGKILYIQPKRNRAEAGNRFHLVREGETMYEIAQHYAIKLKSLYDRNRMEYGTEPIPGQELALRGRIRGDSEIKVKEEKSRERFEPKNEPEERDKMEFEFFE